MSTIKLHPVKRPAKGHNRFCGPAILSILSGIDTAAASRLLRSINGARSIKGTSTYLISRALIRLGIRADYFPRSFGTSRKLTFVQWARQSQPHRDADTAVLLVMGHHWAVVQGRRYACGLTEKPVPFSQVPHRCARVTEAFRLVRVGDAKAAASVAVPPVPVRPADPDRAIRQESKKLAAAHGIQIESNSGYDHLNPDEDGVFVYPPTHLYGDDGESDPFDGDRSCYCWQDVMDRVRVYADAVLARQASAPSAVPA